MLGQEISGPTALSDMAANDTPSIAAHIHHIHTSHIAASAGVQHNNVSASSVTHHPNRSQHGAPQYAGSRVVDIARMENSIRQMYNDKLRGSTQAVVNALAMELPRDHVFAQLMSDATTQPFCKVRVGEVVEAFLYSVQAHQYHNLASELSKLEFDHYQLTVEYDELTATMEQQALGYEQAMQELRNDRSAMAVAQQLHADEDAEHCRDVVNKSTQATMAANVATRSISCQNTQTIHTGAVALPASNPDEITAALEESERLRQELRKHQDALSTAQGLNKEQRDRIEQMERSATDAELIRVDLERAIEALSIENMELRSEMLHNASVTATMRDDLVAVQKEAAAEVAALEKHASARDAECASIRLSLEAAHQELAVLGAAHDEAVHAGTKLKDAHVRLVAELEERRNREVALAAAVEDERLHRASLATSQSAAEGVLGGLQAERERLEDELRRERARSTTGDERLQQMVVALAEAKSALVDATARSTELELQVNELRANAGERDAADNALRQQLDEARAQCQAANQSLERAEDRVAAAEVRSQDKDAAHTTQLAMLRAAFTESAAVLQQELHALRQSNSASHEARRLDESSVEHRLLERLTAAHDEHMRLVEENTELCLNLSANNHRLSALTADLAAMERMHAALQEDHEQLRDVFSMLQARHERLKAVMAASPPSAAGGASLMMSPISAHGDVQPHDAHPIHGASPCRDASVSACEGPDAVASQPSVDIAVEALMATLQQHDAAAVREVKAVGSALLSALEEQRNVAPPSGPTAAEALEATLAPLMHRIEALIAMEHDNTVALHESQMETQAIAEASAAQREALHVTYEVLRTMQTIVGGPQAQQEGDETMVRVASQPISGIVSLARDVLTAVIASSSRVAQLQVDVGAALSGLMERVDASYQSHVASLLHAHHQCWQDVQRTMEEEALHGTTLGGGEDARVDGGAGGPIQSTMRRYIRGVAARTRLHIAQQVPLRCEHRDQRCGTDATPLRDASVQRDASPLQVSVAATQVEGLEDAHALYHSILDEANQMLYEQRGLEHHLEATKASEQQALAAARRWQTTAQELEALLDDESSVVGDLREALERLKHDVASSQALFDAQMGGLHGQYHAMSQRCIQEERRNAVLHERCVTKEKRIGVLERQMAGCAAIPTDDRTAALSVNGRQHASSSPRTTGSIIQSPQPHRAGASPTWSSGKRTLLAHQTAGMTPIEGKHSGLYRAATYRDEDGSPTGLSPSPIPPVYEGVR